MKSKILIILFLMSFLGFSQSEKRFILLTEPTFKNAKIYTLDTQKMYGIQAQIELYNVKGYHNYILFSVLPDLHTNQNWQEIPYLLIEKDILPDREVENVIWGERELKIFNKYRLVKKVDGKFFVAKNVLIEKFRIANYDTTLKISGRNIINTKDHIRTFSEVKKAYITELKKDFPEDYKDYIIDEFSAIYLEDIQQKNQEKIYLFWTLDDWQIPLGSFKNDHYEKEVRTPNDYAYHRGIDRFAYIDGKGIVGGSYDFYFDQTPDGFRREIGRDIMWAKELFPERQ